MNILAQFKLDRESDIKESKENHIQRWIVKPKISPYSVDLVAVRERALSEQKSKNNKQRSQLVETDGGKEKARTNVFSTVSFYMQTSLYLATTSVDFDYSILNASFHF